MGWGDFLGSHNFESGEYDLHKSLIHCNWSVSVYAWILP